MQGNERNWGRRYHATAGLQHLNQLPTPPNLRPW